MRRVKRGQGRRRGIRDWAFAEAAHWQTLSRTEHLKASNQHLAGRVRKKRLTLQTGKRLREGQERSHGRWHRRRTCTMPHHC